MRWAPVFPLESLGVIYYLAAAMSDSPTLTLLPGTLELCILRALRWEPTHGSGIGEWIRLVTDGAFDLEEGTLYPALHRLQRRGLIESEWGVSDHGRRARFYHLTAAGRARLPQLLSGWERYVEAVNRVARYGHPALWAQAPSS
jgi:transcriptional regulator